MTALVRRGRWQDVLGEVEPGTVITDPPYGKRTHASDPSAHRNDGAELTAIDYSGWTRDDVHEFTRSWLPRTSRWLVAMTSHDLIPHWESAIADAGWYAFAPLAAVISGMGVRQLADGPASWVIHIVVARRRSKQLGTEGGKIWRSLPGGYAGPATAGMAGGRGKPPWLTDDLVRDYSNPGDIVCDPFAGWGSTLVSARNAGRDAIGSEMDPVAFARCEAALAGDSTAFARLGRRRKLANDGQVDMFEAAP